MTITRARRHRAEQLLIYPRGMAGLRARLARHLVRSLDLRVEVDWSPPECDDEYARVEVVADWERDMVAPGAARVVEIRAQAFDGRIAIAADGSGRVI